MSVRVGVVVFPGSNCDTDTTWALARAGAEPVELWHEHADLGGVAAVVLPGGFAYGDYLRAGAIARFSPVMQAVQPSPRGRPRARASATAFRSSAEAGLLPGALIRNRSLQVPSACASRSGKTGRLAVHPPVPPDQPLRLPIAHGEGCLLADEESSTRLEDECGVLCRYVGEHGPAG